MAIFEDFLGGVSNTLSGGNNAKAAAANQQAVNMFKDLEDPDLQELDLETLVQQGQITPEMAQAYLADRSAMNDISLDPRLQQAQMDALSSLQDISSSGGMTAEDKANLNRIQTQEQTAQRGSREAILQNMQARGMGGSGMELLSQMQNQQDSATRQNQRDLDVAGMAQSRALQALSQAGQLGGQIGAQQFGQQAQVAGANDAISQFNAQQRQQVGNLNTGISNEAQAQNLAAKQKMADSNVGIKNEQQAYNKGLAQQQYDNKIKKASGVAGALGNQAEGFNQAGQGIQRLIGTGITAGASLSDKNAKKKITDWDPSEFLDSLTSHKYRYKDEKYGKGDQTGVMAQELEKTDEGRALVDETSEGKVVNYGRGFGTMAAAMASLHERLKELEGRGKSA